MRLIQRYSNVGIEKDGDGVDFFLFGENKYLEADLGWRECLDFAVGFNNLLREILQTPIENTKYHYERILRELEIAKAVGRDTEELTKHLENVRKKTERLERIRDKLMEINDVINEYVKGGEKVE